MSELSATSELRGLKFSAFFYFIEMYLLNFFSPLRTLKITLIMPRAAKTSVLWLEENATIGKFRVN